MWKRVVLILLVLAGLAYSALWFNHAGQTEAKMAQMLQDLSGKEGLPPTGVKVTYDDLSVTGFPTEFVTHINNPVITIDAMQFMQRLTQQAQAVAPTETSTPTLDKITLKGDVAIGVNYYTNTIGLKVTGDSEGVSIVEGKEIAWQTKQQGEAGCAISMSRDADMSIFKNNAFTPLENPEQLFNTFKSIDCLADPMEVTMKDTGEMLYRGGEQIFSVTMDKLAENEVSVAALLTMHDLEMSDQWQEWIEKIKSNFNPQAIHTGVLPISSYEAVGKQNVEFKMNYLGPIHFDNLENANIKLDVPSFSVSNNLYTLNFPMQANISIKGGQRTGDITIKGHTKYNDSIDGFAAASVRQMIETAYSEKTEGVESPLAAITSRIGKEEMIERIQAVIPALGALKEFHTNVDLSFKGTSGETAMDVTGDGTVRSLELRAGAYGFSATGSGAFPPPRGELSIRCHTCNDTVDKLVLYATNVQKLISLLDNNTPQIPDSLAFRTAAASFINQISTPAEDNTQDRMIQVSDSGTGQIVISGKTMQEVTMLGMQTFLPFFVKAPPGAPH